MADYESMLVVFAEAFDDVNAPSDLQNDLALNAFVSDQEAMVTAELTSLGYTEEAGTFAITYNAERTELTLAWETSSQPYTSVAPLVASCPVLPGRA